MLLASFEYAILLMASLEQTAFVSLASLIYFHTTECFLEGFQENSIQKHLILRFIDTKAQYCLNSKTAHPMDYFVQP